MDGLRLSLVVSGASLLQLVGAGVSFAGAGALSNSPLISAVPLLCELGVAESFALGPIESMAPGAVELLALGAVESLALGAVESPPLGAPESLPMGRMSGAAGSLIVSRALPTSRFAATRSPFNWRVPPELTCSLPGVVAGRASVRLAMGSPASMLSAMGSLHSGADTGTGSGTRVVLSGPRLSGIRGELRLLERLG